MHSSIWLLLKSHLLNELHLYPYVSRFFYKHSIKKYDDDHQDNKCDNTTHNKAIYLNAALPPFEKTMIDPINSNISAAPIKY